LIEVASVFPETTFMVSLYFHWKITWNKMAYLMNSQDNREISVESMGY